MTESFSIQQFLLDQFQIPTTLLTSYKKLGLNETDVLVILQIHRFLKEKNEFPTPEEIAKFLTVDDKQCANILRKLIKKGFLQIVQMINEHHQISEVYSLNPLWEKLYKQGKPKNEEHDHIGTTFILFEQEFGRPLSPFEIEMIHSWLDEDKFSPALIKAALREAVLMSKLNFNYIDRILREWHKKGIRTVEQARESSRVFRERQNRKINNSKQNQERKEDHSIYYYNWLEGE